MISPIDDIKDWTPSSSPAVLSSLFRGSQYVDEELLCGLNSYDLSNDGKVQEDIYEQTDDAIFISFPGVYQDSVVDGGVLYENSAHIVDTTGLPHLPLWKSTKIASLGTLILYGRYVPSTSKYVVKLSGKDWSFKGNTEESNLDVELVLLSQDFGLLLLNGVACKLKLVDGSLVWQKPFPLASVVPIGGVGTRLFLLNKDSQVSHVDLEQDILVNYPISFGVEGTVSTAMVSKDQLYVTLLKGQTVTLVKFDPKSLKVAATHTATGLDSSKFDYVWVVEGDDIKVVKAPLMKKERMWDIKVETQTRLTTFTSAMILLMQPNSKTTSRLFILVIANEESFCFINIQIKYIFKSNALQSGIDHVLDELVHCNDLQLCLVPAPKLNLQQSTTNLYKKALVEQVSSHSYRRWRETVSSLSRI